MSISWAGGEGDVVCLLPPVPHVAVAVRHHWETDVHKRLTLLSWCLRRNCHVGVDANAGVAVGVCVKVKQLQRLRH